MWRLVSHEENHTCSGHTHIICQWFWMMLCFDKVEQHDHSIKVSMCCEHRAIQWPTALAWANYHSITTCGRRDLKQKTNPSGLSGKCAQATEILPAFTLKSIGYESRGN